jgi:hypothetical protein
VARHRRPGTRRTPRYTAVAHFCRSTKPQKKIVTVYFQLVERLCVAATLPLTAPTPEGLSALCRGIAKRGTASGSQQHVPDHLGFTTPSLHRKNSFAKIYLRSHLAYASASLFTAD